MSSPQNNNDHKSSEGCHTLSPQLLIHHHQQQQQQQHQQHLFHMQQMQQMQNYQKQQQQLQQHQDIQTKPTFDSDSCLAQKRNLYAIKEQIEDEDEELGEENKRQASEALDVAYDADVDDDIPMCSGVTVVMTTTESCDNGSGVGNGAAEKALRVEEERQHIYELFQPWALKTYGDQAKTKTITMRKKVRILKALEGKEHSRPDSSKFRFWVKSKGFTTKRPESFEDAPCTPRPMKPLAPNAILSDNPADVDLYVASTNKDFQSPLRHYRKVAVVEEFFDIIYNIHMELGGRSGMHAGQKRTYRIISETYAFLPREAVTRFLSICPECKKNLRPSSPSTSAQVRDEVVAVAPNESSSELEVLNYSSHTESSLEGGSTTKTLTKLPAPLAASLGQPISLAKKRRYSNPDNNSKAFVAPAELVDLTQSLPRRNSSPIISSGSSNIPPPTHASSNLPKIRVNPHLQRPFTPPLMEGSAFAPAHYGFGYDFHFLKSRDNLMRYYDFMRRIYSGNLLMPPAVSTAHLPPPPPLATVINKEMLPSLQKSYSKPLEPLHSTSSSEDDADNITVLSAKRFKSSAESSQTTKALTSSGHFQIPAIATDFIQPTQIRAINLSKNSSPSTFSDNEKLGFEPKTPQPIINIPTPANISATSTPTSVKKEAVTPPRAFSHTSLRVPQMRSVSTLAPLDFERLKPITSTYLQLTRSMGLSDEEALRFDNVFISSMTCLAL
ncbi:uncharacterized protein LOC135950894 [Calliphora vicina]|uniref:uncharacterized protein LOC135950894 n=1 Tax=Calliphora vicina TaxID=7373 RepID=UPI00325B8AB4